MLRQPGLQQITPRRVGLAGGENPLTFTSGLTRVGNTVTNDFATGKAGGQELVGGTVAGDGLVISANLPGLTGPINFEMGNVNFGLVDVTIASSAAASLDLFRVSGPTVTVTGATPITNAAGFNLNRFDPPAVVSAVNIGAGGTTPAGATLVISGPPTIGGGGAFAGIYGAVGLWVKNPTIGQTSAVFDGNVIVGAAAGSTASLQLLGTNGIFITQAAQLINASANATQTIVKAGTGDLVINNGNGAGGLILQGGGVEAFRILSTATAGRIQFAASAMAANGAVATAMTALGPAGSHTTIQEWLTFFNASGVQRWVACF